MKNNIINQLLKLKEKCELPNNPTEFDEGYHLATFCINDSIDTRVSVLQEALEENSSEDIFNNYFDYISSLILILQEECFERNENNKFNNGFKEKANKTIKELEKILNI